MTRVLIIEDEEAIRENIRETLELEGMAVLTAANGRIGVEIALSEMPDLILCDIMMPVLDGYGALLELRSNPRSVTIPLIFLTAKTDRGSMRHGMELGADDYLPKPFSTQELINAVRKQLEKRAELTRDYERRLDDLRANIIYALPHELRTPLTGIMGCLDFLMMDYQDIERESIYSICDIAYRSALRLQRVLENYLSYAQIELIASDAEQLRALKNGYLEHPGTVIAEIASAYGEKAERAADLDIQTGNTPIRMSQENLLKVARELIDNALKFSKPNTPIQVRAGINGDGRWYVLSVTDRGRGMTEDEIQQIGAYSQFNRKLHEQQGLGLGLIIARRLVELHGGQFQIESAPNRGTTVYAAVPAG